MKKGKWSMRVIMFFVASLLLMACGKDNEEDNEVKNGNTEQVKPSTHTQTPTEEDRYYVKYEMKRKKILTYGANGPTNITYKDINEEVTISTMDGEWEVTCGPFKMTDNVYLRVSTFDTFTATSRISVSKNTEPFVVKAEKRDAPKAELYYFIDF